MFTVLQSDTWQEAIVERVWMPDDVQGGRYNSRGEKDENGNVFIVRIADTAQVWAAFESDFQPAQIGAMIFENVPDSGVLDAIVSQWIRGGPGDAGQFYGRVDVEKFNVPNIGEPVILFLSRQRAPGSVRVAGLNSMDSEVSVAAGLLMTIE